MVCVFSLRAHEGTQLLYKFSAECPCLGRNEKGIGLIHVDGLIFTGDSEYINEIFPPKIQGKFDTSVSKKVQTRS